MFQHLLVPTDGSPLSEMAASSAVAFAKEMGAKITALYVKPTFLPPSFGESGQINPVLPEQLDAMEDQDAQRSLGFIEHLCHGMGVVFRPISVSDDYPYKAIIEVAATEAVDLIIMASHGRKGISSILIGSETQKVLTHSKIPVLIYK